MSSERGNPLLTSPLIRRFAINYVLVAGSLPFLAIVAWQIRPTNYGLEEKPSASTVFEKPVVEKPVDSPSSYSGSTVDEARMATGMPELV